MFNEVTQEIEWCGGVLRINTGKLARYADGSVLVSWGGTSVLCTVVFEKDLKEDLDFFPLSVHYREMAYANGKIPGGFNKNEGKPSQHEILVSRLIDRSVRPLFPSNFLNDTQIICTVVSYDPSFGPEVLSVIGASAALSISGIPVIDSVASVRVGLVDEKFILNPVSSLIEDTKLDLMISSLQDTVNMIELQACELEEEKVLEAISFGQEAIRPILDMIKTFADKVNKAKFVPQEQEYPFDEKLKTKISSEIKKIMSIVDKAEREKLLDNLEKQLKLDLAGESVEKKVLCKAITKAFKELVSNELRDMALIQKRRIDGRALDQIRPICCEIGLLERAHGSALFTRGETQSLAAVTLGSSNDGQFVEKLGSDGRQHFLLDYIFLPYSVGETGPIRAASRREIGHGKLAWKAIKPMLPNKENFPYTIRVVSEILESNGSSSMATVCSTSMSLMQAGVPMKSQVAGIAMGLIKSDEKVAILSDIMGCEDFLGDMDFKVAGTEKGINALQLDVKVEGISIELIKKTLQQARQGINHILGIMNKTVSSPNIELSSYAPRIEIFKIAPDKKRDVIGAGGKVIREITNSTGADININEDCSVEVFSSDPEGLRKAVEAIQAIVMVPEVGQIFNGTVVNILESGVFVSLTASKDGFLPIGEISKDRSNIENHVKVGQKLRIKVCEINPKGKIRVTLKIDQDTKATTTKRPKTEEVAKSNQQNKRSKPADTIVSPRKYFN